MMVFVWLVVYVVFLLYFFLVRFTWYFILHNFIITTINYVYIILRGGVCKFTFVCSRWRKIPTCLPVLSCDMVMEMEMMEGGMYGVKKYIKKIKRIYLPTIYYLFCYTCAVVSDGDIISYLRVVHVLGCECECARVVLVGAVFRHPE